jgi:hypothetical protein
MRISYLTCLGLFVTILICTPLSTFAQERWKSLEERLPSISLEGCNSQPNLFVPTTTHTLSLESYRARDLFSKRVPEGEPKAISEAVISRQTDLKQLFENMNPENALPKNGEKLLSGLSDELQKFIGTNYRIPEGRALTALLVFVTDPSGKLQWCLVYYVFVDDGALMTSGIFSAEKTIDNKLIVTLVGRDINRAKLSSAVAVGLALNDRNRGFACGSLSSNNLPPTRK